ncbi:unnamed protein product [Meloidogyne enterolobii]|uniref:Uncharacterized protein n=1 Tax=Meloidogyne enterolobii TaxID=390850 RepID=A0ACB0ZPV0_MELEN
MTPEESHNLIVGPGIIVENEFNGDEEFYPLECLGIDIINYPDLIGNETENLGLSSLEVDVDLISGDLKNLKININNNNTIQLQATLNADIHSDGGNTNVGITEIKTKVTIWKKATTILLLFLLITGTCAGPEKNKKNKDLDDILNDLLEEDCDIVDMSNNNLQNAEVQLFNKNIDNNNNNTQSPASVATRPQPQTSAENKQIVHVFEQILESWIATRPMSSSSAAAATNSLQQTPSTSQTTTTPTPTSPPIAAIVPQQQLPFEQENPFTQQQSAAGPIRNSYNNRKNCFVCGKIGHLTKSCPTLLQLKCRPSTSHSITTYLTAKSTKKVYHELMDMKNRWENMPAIATIIQILAELFLHLSKSVRD